MDSRESLKAVPSWTSRRSRIRSVKIVSEGQNRIRRVKVGPGRVVPEGQNRIRVAFGVSKSHPVGQSASGEPFRRIKMAPGTGRKLKVVPGRVLSEGQSRIRRVKVAFGREVAGKFKTKRGSQDAQEWPGCLI